MQAPNDFDLSSLASCVLNNVPRRGRYLDYNLYGTVHAGSVSN